jgi:hypothetical protein
LIRGTGPRVLRGLLRISFGYVRIVNLLLLFLEGFFLGKFLRAGLFACGQQLLQIAARFIGILHQSIWQNRIRMPHHARRSVRCIADVATIDHKSLAVANIGHVELDVLRGGSTHPSHTSRGESQRNNRSSKCSQVHPF